MPINDYINRADIQASMPDTAWDVKYNSALDLIATVASRAIDDHCRREHGAFAVSDTSVRYYDGSGRGIMYPDEMADNPTEVAVDEAWTGTYTVWTINTDFYLEPYNAPLVQEPYNCLTVNRLNGSKVIFYRFPRSVKITCKFGYSMTVPAIIKRCATIWAIRLFKRAQIAYEDTSANVDLGQLFYTKMIDPDIVALLPPKYIRMAI